MARVYSAFSDLNKSKWESAANKHKRFAPLNPLLKKKLQHGEAKNYLCNHAHTHLHILTRTRTHTQFDVDKNDYPLHNFSIDYRFIHIQPNHILNVTLILINSSIRLTYLLIWFFIAQLCHHFSPARKIATILRFILVFHFSSGIFFRSSFVF